MIIYIYQRKQPHQDQDDERITNMETKITRTYSNPNSGGKERATRIGNEYYIESDFGDGFNGKRKVTRDDMEACLSYTKAPEAVVSAILGE